MIGILGFSSWQGLGIFLFTTVSGAHLSSYPMGTVGSFPRGKTAGVWSWPPPPSSAKVKYAWSYTSTPPIWLHVMVLSEAQG
jgi:hypothetical protein